MAVALVVVAATARLLAQAAAGQPALPAELGEGAKSAVNPFGGGRAASGPRGMAAAAPGAKKGAGRSAVNPFGR